MTRNFGNLNVVNKLEGEKELYNEHKFAEGIFHHDHNFTFTNQNQEAKCDE